MNPLEQSINKLAAANAMPRLEFLGRGTALDHCTITLKIPDGLDKLTDRDAYTLAKELNDATLAVRRKWSRRFMEEGIAAIQTLLPTTETT